MHDLPSSISNSRDAALTPRSKSRQRSFGKCRPILAAMKALSRERCLSGMSLVNFTLFILQKSSILSHGCIERSFLFQREKFVEVMNEKHSIFKRCHTVYIIDPGQDIRCVDDITRRNLHQ